MGTWDDLVVGVGSGKDADQKMQARTRDLRTCFVGPVAPTVIDPDDIGTLWLDTSGTTPALRQYMDLDGSGASWQPIGPLSRLPASINADPDLLDGRAAPYEHKALRVENRGALPAATATNKGLVVFLTTNGELYVADQGISGVFKGLLSVTQLTSYDTQELDLQGDVGNDATHPPTRALSGVLEGWKFDATNEKRTFAFVVPKNWQGATDIRLRLHQVLEIAQTAGDAIEWSGEYRALTPAQAKTGKAASALVDVSQSIGADVDGIDAGGGPHISTLVLPYAGVAGANAIAAGSLLLVTVWRKTVGGATKVSGTIVFRADLAYAQRPRHERA